MIYYYLIKVQYTKGKDSIIKEYRKSFLELAELFDFLEKRHKYNYTIISILPLHYTKGYQRVSKF